MLTPVAFGFLGSMLPAFGYLPALGGDSLSLWPWQKLFADPALWSASFLALWVGLAATGCSLLLTMGFFAAWQGTRSFTIFLRLLSPLLSVPHVTLTFGLAFLLAPSGWIIRLLSPWPSGFQTPPDWLILNDPYGFSLILALILKEVPFLFLMGVSALNQIESQRSLATMRSMGYGPLAAWSKVIFPQIYPQIRLPVFAVLAFSISVVDVSLIIGPSTPPPLSVLLLRWSQDPDLEWRFVAAAGGLWQCFLLIIAIGGWFLGERLVKKIGLLWILCGHRFSSDVILRYSFLLINMVSFLCAYLGMMAMGVWSIAGYWRFPDALPERYSLTSWARQLDQIAVPLTNSLWIGLASAFIALALSLLWLQETSSCHASPSPQNSGKRQAAKLPFLLYIPLLIPQMSFLFGVQTFVLFIGWHQTWVTLLWSHLLFVLPYVFLSLSEAYQSFDSRYERAALCLGLSPLHVWWRVKLPMLLRPILAAMALGFAVSIAQYLPTLLSGGGRFPTLTTEAVALASGGNRRVIGIYALLQMLLPFLAYMLALGLPAWLYRHRRALHTHGGL